MPLRSTTRQREPRDRLKEIRGLKIEHRPGSREKQPDKRGRDRDKRTRMMLIFCPCKTIQMREMISLMILRINLILMRFQLIFE